MSENKLQDLSRCEHRIMTEVWRMGGTDCRTLVEVMVAKGYSWKMQTISTFLSRLVKKGYLDVARKGKNFFYTPRIDKHLYASKLQSEYEEFCRCTGVR